MLILSQSFKRRGVETIHMQRTLDMETENLKFYRG